MTESAYPKNIDFVWLAVDRDNDVAAFITAGRGPIPVNFLDVEDYNIFDVEQRLDRLPRLSEVRLLVELPRPDDFINISQRGIFVYDWRDVHRTIREEIRKYELIAAPLRPIKELPDDLAGLAARSRLAKIGFANENTVDVRAELSCAEASCNEG
jgi:hypothetical protein